MTRTLTHRTGIDAEELRRLPRGLAILRIGAVIVIATIVALLLR